MLKGLTEWVETFVIWAALTLVETGAIAYLVEFIVVMGVLTVALLVLMSVWALLVAGWERLRGELGEEHVARQGR